jgi:type II secretory pathway pseudopilin PulG
MLNHKNNLLNKEATLSSNQTNIDTQHNTHRLFLAKVRLKQSGFNALELTLVLAVIAIAIVGVIRVMGTNTDKTNSNQMVGDVGAMVSNIRNAFSSTTTGYTGLNNTSAINMKLIPAVLRISGTNIKNQFQGGTVVLTSGTGGDNFSIKYTNVPSTVCSSVVNTLGGAAFLIIKINEQSVYDVNAGTPLEAQKVGEHCKTGGEKSTIEFIAS